MIVVTAANGIVSREVVRRLTQDGADVRAMVRDLDKGTYNLGPLGAEIFYGNFDRADTIANALEGATAVFLASPVSEWLPARERRFIDAAAEAGVEQLIKLSALGAGPRSSLHLGRMHDDVQQHLARQSFSWTTLRPGLFMQSVLPCARQLNEKGKIVAPAGNGRVAPIDVRDVARVAARIFRDGPGAHSGRTYDLTGPELLDFATMANTLTDVLGRRVRYSDVTGAEFRDLLRANDIGDETARMLGEIFTAVGLGVFGFKTDTVEAITGAPPSDFRQFATDFAEVFCNPDALEAMLTPRR